METVRVTVRIHDKHTEWGAQTSTAPNLNTPYLIIDIGASNWLCRITTVMHCSESDLIADERWKI